MTQETVFHFAHSLGEVIKYHETVNEVAIIMCAIKGNKNGTHFCAVVSHDGDEFIVSQTPVAEAQTAEKMFRAIVNQIR